MMMQNLVGWSFWLGALESASRAPLTERLLWGTLSACLAIILFVVSQRHQAAHEALKSQLRHHLDALARAEKTGEHLRKTAQSAQSARHTAEIAEAQHRRRAFDAKADIARLEALLAESLEDASQLRDQAQQMRLASEHVLESRPRARVKSEDADRRVPQVPSAATKPQIAVSPATEDVSQSILDARVAELEGQLEALTAASAHQKMQDHQRFAQAAHALKTSKKRVEDLRRIDLMTKNKISLLEDRLARLGREHYEAISALSEARGEVPQAQPRRRAEEPSSLQH